MIIKVKPSCWRRSVSVVINYSAPGARARCSRLIMIGCCGSIETDMRRHAGRLPSCRPSIKAGAGSDIGLELPLIIEMGERNGRFFSVDRRFSGRNFSGWLQHADMTQRRPALISFLDATERLQQLPSPVPGFARLIGEGAPQQFGTLAELLSSMLRDRSRAAGPSWNATFPMWPRFGTSCMAISGSGPLPQRLCMVTSVRPTPTSAKARRDRLSPESLTSARTRCKPTP